MSQSSTQLLRPVAALGDLGRSAQATHLNSAVAAAPGGSASISCPYCRSAVPTVAFMAWSTLQKLFSAHCPTCARRITVGARTWRRWLSAEGVPRAS